VKKVKRILKKLSIHPKDCVFIDEDAFERDSIFVQIPEITTWSIPQLEAYLKDSRDLVTEESRRRPKIYRQQQSRLSDGKKAKNYTEFLQSCHIQMTIRPYAEDDALRAEELLIRTHQMNLGVLPVDEAVKRLDSPGYNHVIMAEMKDIYGEMGRTGIVHLKPDEDGSALIESLAISCRTMARGLSLAMLLGLLRHPRANFQAFRCRYVNNGFNRPLRMLLLAAGFKPQTKSEELILSAERLAAAKSPDWVNIVFEDYAQEEK
jgi:FkbH-like protein